MAVVPFTGPAKAPDLDVDPSFLQMAGAVIHTENKLAQAKPETEPDAPNNDL